MQTFTVSGLLVNVFNKTIQLATITVSNGKIAAIEHTGEPISANEAPASADYLLPGFIDSHVHVESSMLVPGEFAKLAVRHGTIATISDPHEIANVCGMEGVLFMIEDGKKVNFKFNFGAPSCVPATTFETAGATLDSAAVTQLLEMDEVKYLSEMMNFPGVLFNDPEVMRKIEAAHALGKPVDGHAPGLRGEQAKQYIDAGISTDHECFTKEEALDKLQYGMKILIREGSAAKNFEALIELLHDYPDQIMFCSDDKHPDSLVAGHINDLCARAVAKGIDVFKVLQAACVNPALHYKLDTGLLRVGDPADFIVVNNLTDFTVRATYINGALVAKDGVSFIKPSPVQQPVNQFDCAPITIEDVVMPIGSYPEEEGLIPVIEALDGQLITNKLMLHAHVANGNYISNVEHDVLKMVVVNRYHKAPVAKCFIRNFGLKQGALASSVAHDSHNIVAVGTNDEALVQAINLVIAEQGGVSAVSNERAMVLGLPVAGLMSADDGYAVADAYTAIDNMTKQELGSTLAAPFMTLSFMALLVIPHLKLSDKGLFDGDTFTFVQ